MLQTFLVSVLESGLVGCAKCSKLDPPMPPLPEGSPDETMKKLQIKTVLNAPKFKKTQL